MKAGEVVHIRVNADDVMGCIDIVRQAGLYVQGMSLAQVVRLALSGLIEAARKHEVIPRRDGFEYMQMLAPFMAAKQSGRKLQISNIIENAEAARIAVDAPASSMNISLRQPSATPQRTKGAEDLFDELVGRKGRLLVRAQELDFKMKNDPLNFDQQQQMELDDVQRQIAELTAKLEELA